MMHTSQRDERLSATSKVYKNLHLEKIVFLVLYSSPMMPKAVQ